MILFLANTPMQLMNAAILAKTIFAKKNCDVYYTANLDIQAKRAFEKEIFSNIYPITLVEDIGNRNTAINRAIVRIKNALDLRKIKRSLPSNPKNYERVLASGVSLRNYEIYYAIKSLNKKVKLDLYEEGVCEYYYLAKKSLGKLLFSYLFFGRYYVNDCETLYVHSPEMVSLAWEHIKIKKIPDAFEDVKFLNDISEVMGYQPTELKDRKNCIVVLEQAFYSEEEENYQKKVIQELVRIFKVENVVIKLHPRSPEKKYGEEFCYLKTEAPFEIVALNEPILSHTFVSIASSSVLNFKLMLDMESNVIVLSHMEDGEPEDPTEFDKLVMRIQKATPSSKVYVPYSKEEFLGILNKIN